MNLEHLILIKTDIIAQKMVASWPGVAKRLSTKIKWPTWGKDIDNATRELVFCLWAEASATNIYDINKRAEMLFRNEICYPNGRSDELALSFIKRKVRKPKKEESPIDGQKEGTEEIEEDAP